MNEKALALIRRRNNHSAPMWFTVPDSFTALAVRDRRALLEEIDAQRTSRPVTLRAWDARLAKAFEAVVAFEDPDSLRDQETDVELRSAAAAAWDELRAAIKGFAHDIAR